MNETHATKYLLRLQTAQPSGTAERTRRLLSHLGDPQKHLFVIKIIGEAGKSSAASLVASLLTHGDIRTGVVTLTPKSEPRLAIRVDGAPPTHTEFAEAVTLAWHTARACLIEQPSYEEMLLAAALHLFVKQGCRTALIELSADSRLSAAQALSSPQLCLLTSTTWERAESLMPLIDTSGDLVSAPQEPRVYRLLTERAAQTHCRLSVPTKNDVGESSIQNGRLFFTYRNKSFSLPTLANYHKSNALAVIEAYHALVRQGFRLSEPHLSHAFSDMSTPLCFHFVSLSPAWLIDAASTPMRLAALENTIQTLPALFGEPLTLWTEPHLESACRDTFGERLGHMELLERGTLHRTMKKLQPPKASPLLVIGTEAFAAEAVRTMNTLFL